jgi:hypothetical protein
MSNFHYETRWHAEMLRGTQKSSIELETPFQVGTVPQSLLDDVHLALENDREKFLHNQSFSPHHPDEAFELWESRHHEDRFIHTAEAHRKLVEYTLSEAEYAIRGLRPVSMKIRAYGKNYQNSGKWQNHPSSVTYWDYEDYYFPTERNRLAVSSTDSLEVLTGTIDIKSSPWTVTKDIHYKKGLIRKKEISFTHQQLDWDKFLQATDNELEDHGLEIIPVRAGEIALLGQSVIARRQNKQMPGSTYLELGFAQSIPPVPR